MIHMQSADTALVHVGILRAALEVRNVHYASKYRNTYEYLWQWRYI